jgi:glycosyltransferase involved in cell wall biosynthesis
MSPELDIVIPVYNEGANIVRVLDSLRRHVRTRYRVSICYDRDDDDTLTALAGYPKADPEIRFVKNRGKGALGAVVTGFEDSTAPAVLVFPADDDYNAHRLDGMVAEFRRGRDIVMACRFMPGGRMVRCPPLKEAFIRLGGFVLYHVAGVPARDPTNGFRLFSRRVIRRIPIETQKGFAYALELLVKCHRLGWKVGEVPVHWYERTAGQSRFKVIGWVPQYLEWVRYALATTFLLRGPETIPLKPDPDAPTTVLPAAPSTAEPPATAAAAARPA